MNWTEASRCDLRIGRITTKIHPKYPELSLFNHATNGQILDCDSLTTRGIIINTLTGDLVATPFPTFFSLNEWNHHHGDLPQTLLFEKLIGSLGIAFYYKDEWHLCTRGSFVSGPAAWGYKWFKTYITDASLHTNMTYLFEIVYDENSPTGMPCDFSGLVLLCIVETKTGIDCTTMPLPTLRGSPPHYHNNNYIRTAQRIGRVQYFGSTK